jgi:hypothetical protein
MYDAARQALIIAEPILSQSQFKAVGYSALACRLPYNSGSGAQSHRFTLSPHRFTEESLERFHCWIVQDLGREIPE